MICAFVANIDTPGHIQRSGFDAQSQLFAGPGHFPISAANITVNGEFIGINNDGTPAAGTNYTAHGTCRAIKNSFIGIKRHRVPFIGLKQGNTIIIFSVSGMGFKVFDSFFCRTDQYFTGSIFALSINKSISNVSLNFFRENG